MRLPLDLTLTFNMSAVQRGAAAVSKHIQFGEDAKKARKDGYKSEVEREERQDRVHRQNKEDAILEARTALKSTLELLQGDGSSPKKEKINYKGDPSKLAAEARKKAHQDKIALERGDGDDEDTEGQHGFLSNYERRNLDSLYRASTGVPRFDAYLSQKKERMHRLQQEADRREAAELQDKPKITKYKGIQGVERLPIYKRDPRLIEDQKIQTIEQAMTQREIDDLRQCTFKPDLSRSKSRKNGHSQRAVNNRNDSDSENDTREPITAVNDLISWKAERDARVAMLRMGQVDGKDAECTFQPSLNPKSRQLTQHRDQTGLALPIKQNRDAFVKEFLEREKQDMFRPKINSNAGEIRDTGYKLGQGVPIKLPAKREKKDSSPPKSARSFKKYRPTQHQKLAVDMDEETIKDRYRIEANPEVIQGKGLSAKLRKHMASQRGLGSPSKSVKSYRSNSRNSQARGRSKSSSRERSLSHRSKSDVKRLVSNSKKRKSKLFERKSSRGRTSRSRSRGSESEQVLKMSGRVHDIDAEVDKIMAKAQRAARQEAARFGSQISKSPSDRKSPRRSKRQDSSSPKRSRSPGLKKSVMFAQDSQSDLPLAESARGKFDSQQWRSIVQDQYELNTRRKVDALIYKDEIEAPPLKPIPASGSKKVANAFKNLNLK